MRIIIPLLFFLVSTIPAWALPVSQGKAKQWALEFFEKKNHSRSEMVSLDMVWNGKDGISRNDGAPAFYVFNRTDRNGFVVVAGDDDVYPLIGYSFENSFHYDNLPSNIRIWFEDVKNEIESIRKFPDHRHMDKEWRSETSVGTVEILLPSAKWDQGAPYNMLCPIDPVTGSRSVTGCTATALAIVMRGYRWPNRGIGSLPAYVYTDAAGREEVMPERSVEHVYNWDNMPEIMDVNTTVDQKNEIAKLMLDCGQMAQSIYNSSSTGGYVQLAIEPLQNNFSYSSNIKLLSRNNYTNKEWEDMMKKELRENGQIVYGGFTSNFEGHAFVLHGYTSSNYFAVNWGWGGYCNGYFRLSQLNPQDQGTGGSADGLAFNYYQDAIVNMKKKIVESQSLELNTFIGENKGVFYNDWGIKTVTETIKENVDVESVLIANLNSQTFHGKLGYCLFDKNNAMKNVVGTVYSIDEIPSYYAVELPAAALAIPESAVNGDYIAVGEWKADVGTFIPIRGQLNTMFKLEIGGFDHAMRDDMIALVEGPQYKDESYGLHTNLEAISKDVEFTLLADELMNISKSIVNCEISVGLYNMKHNLKSVIGKNRIKINDVKPGDILTNLNFNCMITESVFPGDYLSLCYSVDDGTTWGRVRALDNLSAHIKLSSTGDPLTQGTTIEFDKASGNIMVENSLTDEYYILKDTKDGIVQQGSGDKTFVIDTKKLKAARYTLWIYLNKGSENKVSVDLKCGYLK